MYPKVKVREEIEEGDGYDYGRVSLQSLKAFEWLSLDHYSSDESLGSVIRIPGSDFPKSPAPGSQASKEEVNKNKREIVGGSNKYVRATSVPRLRSHASSSSPDSNNEVLICKTRAMRGLLLPLRSHDSCPNRHARCKISPVSGDAEFSPQHSHDKHTLMESKKRILKRKTNFSSRKTTKEEG